MQGLGTSGADPSDRWNFLFQGKEYVDAFGLNLSDFHSRLNDQNLGRFWQVDGADQFASGYISMGNMPTVGIDPDGQFWQYVVGAAVGGGLNLASNWSKIKGTGLKGFAHGFAYFTAGAVGGAVSINNIMAGGAITSGGNAFIDIATGNVPNIKNFGEAAKYVGIEVAKGVVTSYIGGQAGKYIGPKLGSLFSWTQQGFAQYAPGAVTIGKDVVEWAYIGGIKSAYGKVGGAVGASVGKQAANLVDDAANSGAKEFTKVGRWMSEAEYQSIQSTGRVVEGAGGQTFAATNGANSFTSATKGSIYAEFEVQTNSLLQGGKDGWVKMIGPNAKSSQQFLLQKQGGELLPKIRNLSDVLFKR